jgi:hypothetical protein
MLCPPAAAELLCRAHSCTVLGQNKQENDVDGLLTVCACKDVIGAERKVHGLNWLI